MPKSLDPLSWFSIARDAMAFAIAAGAGIVAWHRRSSARHWPMVNGRVEYGMTSDIDGWRISLVYSYTVSGSYYSGVHSLKARNETDADAKVHGWKGQNLTVRYSPKKPEISVARKEDQASFMTFNRQL